MKKLITIIIPVVLILLVAVVGAGTFLYERYSYTKERADVAAYYQLVESDKVAITIQNERVDAQALIIGEMYYLDIDSVKEYLNDRFYVDYNESLLLYTTAVNTSRVVIEESQYIQDDVMTGTDYIIATYQGETLYVALDYVQNFTNFSYEVYTDPNRMQIYTEFQTYEVATLTKDSAVRELGGVKSPILRDLEEGEEVIILEEMDEWSKIKTNDTYIGYVENKLLDNYTTRTIQEVTDYVEVEYTSVHKDYKISMGWHQVTNVDANGLLGDVLGTSTGINTISPTWYYLSDNEGGLLDISSASYVQTAHNSGVEVWALIENITYSSDIDFKEIMSYTTKRTRIIENLVQSVLSCGADGINIDFENVPEDAGEDYIQFIRELSVVCREEGLVLSIDNYVPMAHTEHYNREEQGIVADYVVIMGYDEHWHGSGDAGSVASFEFVKSGITQTLAEVPAEKIINGIPFYTNIWKTEGGVTTDQQVGMAYAEQFVAESGAEPIWDEVTLQYYVKWTSGEAMYEIWLEEESSIEAKLGLMDYYEIAGVAQWKLGLEKSQIWDVINAYLEN
ncbi:MAG: glycosyl hydrolase family 18 protein [Eubacteriales bacterium]